MSHITERRFADEYALPWLRDRFPDASIETQRWVDATDGFVDAWVELPGDRVAPGIVLAVEIGNDDSVRDECAQAVEYASNHARAVPYVIIPDRHADGAVVDVFRSRGVVVVELSGDWD